MNVISKLIFRFKLWLFHDFFEIKIRTITFFSEILKIKYRLNIDIVIERTIKKEYTIFIFNETILLNSL